MLGQDPETGREIIAKAGRYGPYVTEVLAGDEAASSLKGKAAKVKPRTASLFKDMDLATLDLDAALQLLSPAARRRHGRRAGDRDHRAERPLRALPQEGHRLAVAGRPRSSSSTITLEEALAIYAQPKQRGRAAAAPLKELGDDPVSGKPMVVKDGRFGPYVTDGETNATLRKDDEPESITPERGAELLAEKRAKGPATRKRATKKTTAKKATAKKADRQEDDGEEGDRQEVRLTLPAPPRTARAPCAGRAPYVVAGRGARPRVR